jgi:hypothetical protein
MAQELEKKTKKTPTNVDLATNQQPTSNHHVCFSLNIILLPRASLKLFVPEGNLISLDMPTMWILG